MFIFCCVFPSQILYFLPLQVLEVVWFVVNLYICFPEIYLILVVGVSRILCRIEGDNCDTAEVKKTINYIVTNFFLLSGNCHIGDKLLGTNK